MTDKEWDERLLELEKRMDLIVTNQLIVTECLEKINRTIKQISALLAPPKKMEFPLRKNAH